MAKQRRTAYGIAEDGLNMKLAFLTRDGQQISLQALEQVELSKSLYQHLQDETAGADKIDSWASDGSSSGDLNLDDFATDGLASFKTQPYEQLLQSYSLNQGLIAVNVFDEQIIKLPVNSPSLSNKQKAKLAKENIPRSEFKSGNWQSSIVTINEQPELWIQHGKNQLLDILENYQTNQKSRLYFQLADANEIALANLFIADHTSDSDETSMVLYLGNDYRRALIFEGNKWTFSLPIHVPQHQPEIDVIYSKLSLAMDEAHISDPVNLYVCGDNCYMESIEYLRVQLPNTNVEMWRLHNLILDATASQVYDTDMISRFILPIALAWKALSMDTATIKSNFIPSYIIEGQKVFKIAWHGYLIFALLFLTSLYVTVSYKQLKYNILQEGLLNVALTKEYTDKKEQAETMLAMEKAIERQSANIESIKTLLQNKNPWTEILTRLNNSFQSHPTSWLKNVRKDGNGFKIIGVTTARPNIVYFSNLFPNGSIMNAKHRKIRSFTVWDFEIKYDYPQVDWYKMMEEDAEELRRYQEEKNRAGLIRTDAGTSSKQSLIGQASDQVAKAVTKQDEKVVVRTHTIDIPYPPKNLTENKSDPMVKAYKEIVTAFNGRNDWLMIDLGVKFINNYPNSALRPYVNWYLAYRAWQNRQYEKAYLWMEPLYKSKDALYPYTLLLSSVIFRDNGDRKRAEDNWRAIIQDYPLHPTAKTAKKLQSE